MKTDAKRRADNKWDAENMKIVSCKIRKEKAERFRAACVLNGTTPSSVLRECIDEYLKEQK